MCGLSNAAMSSSVHIWSYRHCVNRPTNFVVDVDAEFLGHLQRYGKRVGDFFFQAPGPGPAADLNF